MSDGTTSIDQLPDTSQINNIKPPQIPQSSPVSQNLGNVENVKIENYGQQLNSEREGSSIVKQIDYNSQLGPALKEGFGLVAIEAQAAGVPCALYNGFPRSVDMKLGLVSFLSSFDCEEWITTILSIKDNKNRDKGAITLAIKNRGFDVKTNTKLIEDFYAK